MFDLAEAQEDSVNYDKPSMVTEDHYSQDSRCVGEAEPQAAGTTTQ